MVDATASGAVCTIPAELPALTLGWDVLWWTTRFIRQPDGPRAGDEWRFTSEQLRFVLHWYAIDETGRWIYTRGVYRRSKGAGKTPTVAALALAELCGPVRFECFAQGGEERPWRVEPYMAGEPIAQPEPAPLVQLAGVSEKQTQNTMTMVLAMCAESPILDEYGLDVAQTRIFMPGTVGRLEPITARAETAEGARPTAVFEDETQHYTDSNGGVKLDQVNRRNVGKSPGGTARVLETTNAHAAGEDSVAERSHQVYLAMRDGRARTSSLLYDSREAPDDVDMADETSLMAGLTAAYGDAWWIDLPRIRDEVWDPATPPSHSRRFYLNQIASTVDAWLTQPEWAGCVDAAKVVADGDRIVLGFDGSRHRAKGVTDATALIGARLGDGHLFEVAVWEQPAGPAGDDWSVPQIEVDAAVHMAFDRWDVVGFYADSSLWESVIADWEARYTKQLKVKASANRPMCWHGTNNFGGRMSRALNQFHAAVVDRQLTHDGSYRLTAHALNARRRPRPSGMQIAKEHPESPRKIDAVVAAVYCWQARLDAVAKGLAEAPRRYRAKGF